MRVKRIVANIEAQNTEAARRFYGEAFGLTVQMDTVRLSW